jgi:hypothetical protein
MSVTHIKKKNSWQNSKELVPAAKKKGIVFPL